MADYYDDEEQAERIKRWLAENGLGLILLVIVAVAGLVGWRQWQVHQNKVAGGASQIYHQMTAALQQAEGSANSDAQAKQVQDEAQKLLKQYPGTAYADFASLALARLAVEDGKLDEAEKHLRNVAAKPANDALKYVANLRLARVMLQKGDLDGAEKLVGQKFPKPWQGRALEIKGDVLLAKKDREGARDAYAAALDAMQQGDMGRKRVQMKLDNLATAS